MFEDTCSSRIKFGFPKKRRLNDRCGVSIIEVLIASVILVAALMGFLSVAATTTHLGGKNSRMSTANALIYDKYEQLKSSSYTNSINSIVTNPSSGIDLDIDIDPSGNIVQGIYDRTVTVTALTDGTLLSVAANVEIKVEWPGHSVTQTSIFMRE